VQDRFAAKCFILQVLFLRGLLGFWTSPHFNFNDGKSSKETSKVKITIEINGVKIAVEWSNRDGHNTKIEAPNGSLSCQTATPQEAVYRALLFSVGQ
jgi:hypothetical protein